MQSVKIDLLNKSYNVNIGNNILHDCLDVYIQNPQNCIFIVDQNVNVNLPDDARVIKLDKCGEEIKAFSCFEYIAEKLLNSYSINRSTILIAIGGGSVGDLCGFIASVMLRGIKYIQVPTTLLAMADSSIGGKTGINSSRFKNMIGSFHQPMGVICDVSFLNSCDDRDWKSGYAEIFKHAIIDDKYDFFNILIDNADKFNAKNLNYVAQILEISCKIKRGIVQEDEFETKGVRELLNFGHTICHGIEKLDSLNHIIRHGEAVAIGMILEIKLAEKMSILKDDSLIYKYIQHLKGVGMNTDLAEFYSLHRISYNIDNVIESMIEIMKMDKKNTSDEIKFILPSNTGKFTKMNISISDLEKCLSELL
jgi:3-dehydroquinate synthase